MNKAASLQRFLFVTDSGRWLDILRLGLGLQVILFAWSLRPDWQSLFGQERGGQVSRLLIEAVLSGNSSLTPRLGWLINAVQFTGLSDTAILWIIWSALFCSGGLLLVGLWPRFVSIASWLLYLATVKSGVLFAYGVDNFTITGLFYLMIAPVLSESLASRETEQHRTSNSGATRVSSPYSATSSLHRLFFCRVFQVLCIRLVERGQYLGSTYAASV
jgi:hypothetical protein